MKAAARVDGDARRPERKGAREKGHRPSWGKSGGCGHAKLEGGPSYGSKLCCCKASGRRCESERKEGGGEEQENLALRCSEK